MSKAPAEQLSVYLNKVGDSSELAQRFVQILADARPAVAVPEPAVKGMDDSALREMAKAVKGGMPREKAMARAFKAGAYWWQIGEYFGISQQAAYEAAKKARRSRR